MDPYVYPGTQVLRNLRGIRDADQLRRFEADTTSFRIRQLESAERPGQLDIPHLQAIHHRIFQDIYDWAGAFRTVGIARQGQYDFSPPVQIFPSLGRLFHELHSEQYLVMTDSDEFISRAAYYMGDINAVHPFRDGNGRTQREFIRQLALRNGYRLNWSRVTPEQMYRASHQSFQRGDYEGLASVLRSALAPPS